MKTLRQIARNIAKAIKQNSSTIFPPDVAEPHIFIDGFIGDEAVEGPVVIVIPRGSTGLAGPRDIEHKIDILVGLDVSQIPGNQARSEADADGILEVGQGDILQGIADRIINLLRETGPGALIDNAETDFDTVSQLPIQFALIRLDYKQFGTLT